MKKNLTVVMLTVLASCASEAYHTPTAEKIYHTQTSNPQTSSPGGLNVLVSKDARIKGSDLIWSCVYQTAEGRVLVEQRDECEITH